MSRSAKDYKIGKCKPPKETRFRKGQSGNPKGRPKGRRNFATELDGILSAPITVTENGQTRTVSCREAALMKLRKKALEGDGRALDRYLDLARQHAADQMATSSERKLTGSEEEILQRYIDCQIGSCELIGERSGREGGGDDTAS